MALSSGNWAPPAPVTASSHQQVTCGGPGPAACCSTVLMSVRVSVSHSGIRPLCLPGAGSEALRLQLSMDPSRAGEFRLALRDTSGNRSVVRFYTHTHLHVYKTAAVSRSYTRNQRVGQHLYLLSTKGLLGKRHFNLKEADPCSPAEYLQCSCYSCKQMIQITRGVIVFKKGFSFTFLFRKPRLYIPFDKHKSALSWKKGHLLKYLGTKKPINLATLVLAYGLRNWEYEFHFFMPPYNFCSPELWCILGKIRAFNWSATVLSLRSLVNME